jgi:hypothetical protein
MNGLGLKSELCDLFCAVLIGHTRTPQQRALLHLIETAARNNYGFLMDFVEDNGSTDEFENIVETFLHDDISWDLIVIVLALFRVARPNARPTTVSILLTSRVWRWMLNCGGLNSLTIFYYLFYCKTQARLELVLFIYKTLIAYPLF